jgi:hypothetical protein
MQNITDVDTFTQPIQCPSDGDDANGANTKVGFQGLSNRTRYLENLRLVQDDLNADNYATMVSRRSDVLTLTSVGNAAAFLTFERPANLTIGDGDYLEFETVGGGIGPFATFESAYITGTNDELTLPPGLWEISVNYQGTNDSDLNPKRSTFELYENGVSLGPLFRGARWSAGTSDSYDIRGTAIVRAGYLTGDPSVYKIRYVVASIGNLTTLASSRMTVKRLSDLDYTYGANAPTNPA